MTAAAKVWCMRVGAVLAGLTVIFLMPEGMLYVSGADGVEVVDTSRRYACPMLCTIRHSPGTCPVCGMDMTEIKGADGQLPLSKREREMIGLRTAGAEFRTLWKVWRTVGRIEADETRVREVAAWIDGRIDRLVADYTGYVVKAGEPLFDVYSPDLYSSQQSFIGAIAAAAAAPADEKAELDRNVESMRRRLELLGLPAPEIARIAKAGKPLPHITVTSPISGTVIDKRVREGAYVKEGMVVATVADLSSLWLKVDVFEEDLPWMAVGQRATVSSRGMPDRPIEGIIAFVDPTLDEKTRTVEARIEIPNTDGRLRPGMFAEVRVEVPLDYDGEPHLVGGEPEDLPKVLAVPEEAVMSTGTRHLVFVLTSPARYVELDDGTQEETAPAVFRAREVRVGPMADGWWPILAGLKPGDRVATRGNFLIDSQMQLSGQPSLLMVPSTGAHAGHAGH